MRAEMMLALRRDSAELEHEVVEQRVDAAYERVYEYLEPAAAYLRSILNAQGLKAFEQYEAASQQAVEILPPEDSLEFRDTHVEVAQLEFRCLLVFLKCRQPFGIV